MLSQETILMVEDDPDDALLIQRALQKAGLRHPVKIVREFRVHVRIRSANQR